MLTQEERLKQAFERGQAQLQQKQDDDAALRAAYEKYHPAEGGGAAVNVGSAKRSISPGAAIGAIVGGVAGGVATAPAGGGGALPGAIIGAGLGELGQQAYDRMTGSAYAPHSLEDSAMRVGKEMGYTAAGEIGARAITFLRPVAYAQPRVLTPEQQHVKTFLDQHQIPYTPDQITGRPFQSFARSIADNGILSEKQMATFARNQNEAIRGAVTDIADTMGQKVPPDVLGQQVVRTIRNEDDTLTRTVIAPLYNRIEQDLAYTSKTVQVPTGRMVPHPSGMLGPNGQPIMIPEMVDQLQTQGGLLVDQRPVKQLFQTEIMNLERTATLEKRPDLLKSAHYLSMKRFVNMPDEGQWADAHQVLKETRKSLRDLDNPMNVSTEVLQDRAVLTRAEKALETQLETSLKQSANPAHQQDLAVWQHAQALTRQKNERLRNDVILSFTKAIDEHGGEKGLTQFVNTMTPDDAAKVMDAARTDPALQGSLRRSFLEDKIIKAGGMDAADAPFNAEKFRKVLFGKDEMNARKSEVLLNPAQRQKLEEFTNVVSEVQRQDTADKFGSVFIRMKSSGAVFTLPNVVAGSLLTMSGVAAVQGDMTTAGLEAGGVVSIVLGPKVLASLLTNPRATEFLIQGLRYSAVNATHTVGRTPGFNAAGVPTTLGGREVTNKHAQFLRITRELMRLDQGFAHAIRTGLSDHFAEPIPPARTAETTTLAPATTSPTLGSMVSSFGLQQ